MPDHVHMMIAIPPKYAVSQVIGYVKGKSAIHLARVYGERKRNFVGQHFWARGYFVSTVGRDEAVIREYIRKQETEDARLDQLVAPIAEVALATPMAALSGPNPKASGFAGGYLAQAEVAQAAGFLCERPSYVSPWLCRPASMIVETVQIASIRFR